MLQAASEDNEVQDRLMEAVEQKSTFQSDDTALNKMIGQVRKPLFSSDVQPNDCAVPFPRNATFDASLIQLTPAGGCNISAKRSIL